MPTPLETLIWTAAGWLIALEICAALILERL